MKRSLSLVIIAVSLMLTATAQNRYPVGVSSNQPGNTVYFSVYNDTGTTVCLFPYVQEQTNVYGSIVGMVEVGAGQAGVNIGAYSQANPQYAWSIRVGSKWREGQCANQ